MSDDPKTLVSTDWLAAHLKDPDLRILDASWYLPGVERDPRAEYDAAHIPGARFFDIDEISDARSDLPHMAPPAEKFMSRMRAMGVGDGHQIVVYDGAGIQSAPRVWWLFRLMGHRDVAVLDGGLPKWQAEGRPVEDMPPVIKDRHLTVRFQNHLVRDVTQVSQAAKLGSTQIVDARSARRACGTGRLLPVRGRRPCASRRRNGPTEREACFRLRATAAAGCRASARAAGRPG